MPDLTRIRSSSLTPRFSNSINESRAIASSSFSELPGVGNDNRVNSQLSSLQLWPACACTALPDLTRFLYKSEVFPSPRILINTSSGASSG